MNNDDRECSSLLAVIIVALLGVIVCRTIVRYPQWFAGHREARNASVETP